MLRKGSPFTGLSVIAMKEAADHMASIRVLLVMLLVLLTALGAVYGAIGQIKATTSEDPFLFLRLFTIAQEPLPSFVAFLGFLLPFSGSRFFPAGFSGIGSGPAYTTGQPGKAGCPGTAAFPPRLR